ncbi:MAG: hypothetical protein ACHQU1_10200 [Gemmatimonadales bacterium]
MIQIEIVPKKGSNAYTLLRSRVHKAATWRWGNRAKTQLRHVQSKGWLTVKKDGAMATAHVVPKDPRDIFYLTEKLTGRLVAWFGNDLESVTVRFGAKKKAGRAKKK